MLGIKCQRSHRDRRLDRHIQRGQAAVGQHQAGGCGGHPIQRVGPTKNHTDGVRPETEAAGTGEREGGRNPVIHHPQTGGTERQPTGGDIGVQGHVQVIHLAAAQNQAGGTGGGAGGGGTKQHLNGAKSR